MRGQLVGTSAPDHQDQGLFELTPVAICECQKPRREEADHRDREGRVGCSRVGCRPPPRPLPSAGPLALLQGEAAQGLRPQVLIIHANDF